MVEEHTEDTDQARPRQQPLVGVDAPVSGTSAGSPQQKGKTLATNSAETLGIFRVSSGGEMTKTRGLLPEAEEKVRLLERQRKLQPVIKKRQINHPQELQKVPGSSATSSQDLDVQPSPSSTLIKATTTASDIDVQLLQVLRKALAFQNQGMVKEYYRMKESNRSQFTGVRMNYHVWKRRFIARVHSQRRLISDKGKVLSNAIDKRKR
jgi:hypothetical protein